MKALQPEDPERVGDYRLVGRLGRGGMGQVFLGESPGGRQVAVKLIRPEVVGDPEFRARFAREVAAARNVSGLFTAPVVDADPDAPEPWLVTAYVPGPSLAEAVQRDGPLPTSAVLALAAGLAEGLIAIHGAGVVHRDLKPSNVLLAADGPRIIDFGISRAVDSTALTRTGLVVGSPGFMSPEQALGREAGPPSDIFCLGAVLAFAATGEGPFGEGTSPHSLLYRIVYGPPAVGDLAPPLRSLVTRCLDKEPGRRPPAKQIIAECASGQPLPGGHAVFPQRPATDVAPTSREPAVAAPDKSGALATAPGHFQPGAVSATLRTGSAAPAAVPGPRADAESQSDPLVRLAAARTPSDGPATSPQTSPPPAARRPADALPPSMGSAHDLPTTAVLAAPGPQTRSSPPDRRPPGPARLPVWLRAALPAAGGAALAAALLLSRHPASPAQASPASPTAVVAAYISAVNHHNWQRVWRLGGRNLGPNYASMAGGRRQTIRDTVRSMSAHADRVTVRFVAHQADGTAQAYLAHYVVLDGVITSGEAVPVPGR